MALRRTLPRHARFAFLACAMKGRSSPNHFSLLRSSSYLHRPALVYNLRVNRVQGLWYPLGAQARGFYWTTASLLINFNQSINHNVVVGSRIGHKR
jgi:hypothetical protein